MTAPSEWDQRAASHPTPLTGWLLVFTVGLIPHIALALASAIGTVRVLADDGSGGLAMESARLVMSAMVFFGHSTALLLILRRHRYAPAFVTFYLALLLLALVVDPDIVTTQVTHAARLGFTSGSAPRAHALAVVRTAFVAGVGVLWLGYWFRSQRVRAVFGSAGLELLRRPRHAL